MSSIPFTGSSSAALQIITAGTGLISKSIQRVQTYNQITSDSIAQNTQRNIKESTDQPIVDQFGQVGLVKPPGIDISV